MFFGGKLNKKTEIAGSTEPRPTERTVRHRAGKLFCKAQKIFKELSAKDLCKLVELKSFEPSDVIAIVPDASPEQLAKFFEIVEETASPQHVDVSTVEADDKAPGSNGGVTISKTAESPAGANVFKTFIDEIKGLVPKISKKENDFSNEFEKYMLRFLGTSNLSPVSEADFYKITFDKLKENPLERSSLEKVHAARAHRYGITHLGPKKWYQENQNLGNKLKTQSDRRKFRAGLKGDFEFINQLNMMDFEECLKAGSSDGLKLMKLKDPELTSKLMKELKDVPPIELIKFINEENATKILQIFEKIVSFAHFGQTMLDYYARVDTLEPALAVVCHLLRQNENIGDFLKDRHTTFLGLAKSFQTVISHADRDFVGRKMHKRSRSTYRRQSSNREAALRMERSKPYEEKFCHHFQNKSICRNKNCALLHRCSFCNPERHGKNVCPRKH